MIIQNMYFGSGNSMAEKRHVMSKRKKLCNCNQVRLKTLAGHEAVEYLGEVSGAIAQGADCTNVARQFHCY